MQQAVATSGEDHRCASRSQYPSSSTSPSKSESADEEGGGGGALGSCMPASIPSSAAAPLASSGSRSASLRFNVGV